MTGDPEFDPDVWWLAERDGTLVGCALHWSSGWLKDLAVRDSERGRGLGAALVTTGLAEFARRGKRRVGLKVDAGNPTGAVAALRAARLRHRAPRGGVGLEPVKAPPASASSAGCAASFASPSRCESGSRRRSRATTPPRRAASSPGSSSPQPSAVTSSACSTSGSGTYELRRTTWRPQARPEAKSSSGSTSSAQPMKCRSRLLLGAPVHRRAALVEPDAAVVAALERRQTLLDGRSFRVPFPHRQQYRGPVAQLVEQGTFNPKVTGSIPVRPMLRLYLQGFSFAGIFGEACASSQTRVRIWVTICFNSPRLQSDCLQLVAAGAMGS